MTTIDLATEDNLQYTFYPVSSGSVTFRVRAGNDAHVALTSGPMESDPMIEVFLGGWGNTKSVIRRNRQKPDVCEVNTGGILNADEFRAFWVRWSGGVITAGREGEAAPLLSYEDPEPFPINHVGVCTGWGATGTWIIEDCNQIETDDSLRYTFSPVTSGDLEFEFRGPSNCHLALTSAPQETDPMYEIIVGGWGNQKSVIRHRRQKPDKVTVETAGIVDVGEFRKFVLQWKCGRVILRSGLGCGDVLMEWTDEAPFPVTHFGVRTAWGATGQWKVHNTCCNFTECVSPHKVPPSMGASAPLIQGGMDIGASCWVDARAGEIPPGAVEGGQDGEKQFVGRAQHEGALIPGKVVQSHGVCYVAWGGGEHGKEEYQVLCGCPSQWVRTSGAAVPANAVPAGETEEGEPLFVGRAEHEGSLTVGKVQGSHGVCYIAYGGQELGFQDYEVLVSQ